MFGFSTAGAQRGEREEEELPDVHGRRSRSASRSDDGIVAPAAAVVVARDDSGDE